MDLQCNAAARIMKNWKLLVTVKRGQCNSFLPAIKLVTTPVVLQLKINMTFSLQSNCPVDVTRFNGFRNIAKSRRLFTFFRNFLPHISLRRQLKRRILHTKFPLQLALQLHLAVRIAEFFRVTGAKFLCWFAVFKSLSRFLYPWYNKIPGCRRKTLKKLTLRSVHLHMLVVL